MGVRTTVVLKSLVLDFVPDFSPLSFSNRHWLQEPVRLLHANAHQKRLCRRTSAVFSGEWPEGLHQTLVLPGLAGSHGGFLFQYSGPKL